MGIKLKIYELWNIRTKLIFYVAFRSVVAVSIVYITTMRLAAANGACSWMTWLRHIAVCQLPALLCLKEKAAIRKTTKVWNNNKLMARLHSPRARTHTHTQRRVYLCGLYTMQHPFYLFCLEQKANTHSTCCFVLDFIIALRMHGGVSTCVCVCI